MMSEDHRETLAPGLMIAEQPEIERGVEMDDVGWLSHRPPNGRGRPGQGCPIVRMKRLPGGSEGMQLGLGVAIARIGWGKQGHVMPLVLERALEQLDRGYNAVDDGLVAVGEVGYVHEPCLRTLLALRLP